MNRLIPILALMSASVFLFTKCNENNRPENKLSADTTINKSKFGGFPSEVSYGKHLVTITGCNDCHTPKMMTAMGPVPDTTLLLSGHPASMPELPIDRKEMESKGLAATNDMTAWAGPWGISYSANLTPDSTGIGSWTNDQFKRALREGKWKGLEGSRQLLPPMPWQDLGAMTDEEINAIFVYLKSIKPVHNIVPMPKPPVTMPRH